MEVQKRGVLSYLAEWVHELDHLHERGLKIEWTFGGGLMWFAVLAFKHQKIQAHLSKVVATEATVRNIARRRVHSTRGNLLSGRIHVHSKEYQEHRA